jgi:hypothetical protein
MGTGGVTRKDSLPRSSVEIQPPPEMRGTEGQQALAPDGGTSTAVSSSRPLPPLPTESFSQVPAQKSKELTSQLGTSVQDDVKHEKLDRSKRRPLPPTPGGGKKKLGKPLPPTPGGVKKKLGKPLPPTPEQSTVSKPGGHKPLPPTPEGGKKLGKPLPPTPEQSTGAKPGGHKPLPPTPGGGKKLQAPSKPLPMTPSKITSQDLDKAVKLDQQLQTLGGSRYNQKVDPQVRGAEPKFGGKQGVCVGMSLARLTGPQGGLGLPEVQTPNDRGLPHPSLRDIEQSWGVGPGSVVNAQKDYVEHAAILTASPQCQQVFEDQRTGVIDPETAKQRLQSMESQHGLFSEDFLRRSNLVEVEMGSISIRNKQQPLHDLIEALTELTGPLSHTDGQAMVILERNDGSAHAMMMRLTDQGLKVMDNESGELLLSSVDKLQAWGKAKELDSSHNPFAQTKANRWRIVQFLPTDTYQKMKDQAGQTPKPSGGNFGEVKAAIERFQPYEQRNVRGLG